MTCPICGGNTKVVDSRPFVDHVIRFRKCYDCGNRFSTTETDSDAQKRMLSNEDFGATLNCAVRYCLGRQTYMPKLVMDYITPLLPHLSEKTLVCMARDVCSHISTVTFAEPEDIRELWVAFYGKIKAAQEGRNR